MKEWLMKLMLLVLVLICCICLGWWKLVGGRVGMFLCSRVWLILFRCLVGMLCLVC